MNSCRYVRFSSDVIIYNANFIYGEKIAIISLNKKCPVGIIIEDQDIVETQAMPLDALWRQNMEQNTE